MPTEALLTNQIHAILTETLPCFLPGRAKDLSVPFLDPPSDIILHLHLGLQSLHFLSGFSTKMFHLFLFLGYRGGSVVKVLCYKSEGRCFDPNWYQWIFH